VRGGEGRGCSMLHLVTFVSDILGGGWEKVLHNGSLGLVVNSGH